MRKVRRCDMPPYAKVRAEYSRGASWAQLGKRYGVDPRSLYNFTRRDAQNAGHTWPIRSSDVRSRSATLAAYDRCNAALLRLELVDFKAWSGVEYKDVAREAGLSPTTIHKITAGIKLTVTRSTVDRVMAVIDRHEALRDAANACTKSSIDDTIVA